MSSSDRLWTFLLERSQRSVSSPTLSSAPRTNSSLQTSALVKPNQVAWTSLLPPSRPQTPVFSSNYSVLSLPLSHSTPRESPLPHSSHQTQSLPFFQPKSHTVLTPDSAIRNLSSPVCYSKFHNTVLPNDKRRATHLPLPPSKPNVSDQSFSSCKHCLRNIAASTLGSRLRSKSGFDLCAKKK